MPKLPDLASGFKTLREIDLNSIRDQAEEAFHLVIVGRTGVGKTTLINQLLSGPGKIEPVFVRPVSKLQLNEDMPTQPVSLVILMIEAGQPEYNAEQEILKKYKSARVPVILCYNKIDLIQNDYAVSNEAIHWTGNEVVAISANDPETIVQKLVPAMMRIYKGREIILARHLPMFREPVSRKLIEDTSFINAAYSLTSGLAEINILLTIPLNIADIVVLTKNQAIMAYKIALSFDLPSDWRQTIPKLTTVVGTGFLWRLIARQLVGLIPAIGIIPQVTVAYAGTYVIGQAIYQWCVNNEKVSPRTLKEMASRALERGREVSRTMVSTRSKIRPA
jgi:uncharacterized protein (DUF697 family)